MLSLIEFERFFEQTNAILIHFDLKSWRILDCNNSAAKFYGYPKATLKEKTLFELDHLGKDDLKELTNLIVKNKTIRYQGRHHLNRNLNRDVEVLFSLIDDVFGVIAIIHDITERKSYLRQLKNSIKETEDIRFALDHSVILSTTDCTGKITYVNKLFCQLSEYSQSELVGKDHRIINSGFHHKKYMEDLWITIENGEIWRGELCNKSKKGKIFWLDTTIVPVMNSDGKPKQFIGINKNITNLKRAERLLQRERTETLVARFEGEEKERNRIAQEIHDGLGQKLTASKLSLAALINRTDIPEDALNQLKYVKKLVTDVALEAGNISGNLLPRVLVDYGLISAVDRMIDELNNVLDLKISFTVGPDFKISKGNQIIPYRIVQEAINNAIKHSECTKIDVQFDTQDDINVFQIKDDGVGFVTSIYKEGYGLRNMRQRASSVNGEVVFKSVPNEGTTVTFCQPV